MTTRTQTKPRIARVCFTYTMPDGLWIERADGTRSWEHRDAIRKVLGLNERTRLYSIAMADGMTGMWMNVDNGRNVFVDGVEVN